MRCGAELCIQLRRDSGTFCASNVWMGCVARGAQLTSSASHRREYITAVSSGGARGPGAAVRLGNDKRNQVYTHTHTHTHTHTQMRKFENSPWRLKIRDTCPNEMLSDGKVRHPSNFAPSDARRFTKVILVAPPPPTAAPPGGHH